MESENEQFEKRDLTFKAKFLLAALVLLASSIAFCCTCIPVGFVAFEVGGGVIKDSPTPEELTRTNLIFSFAFFVGGMVALFVGYKVFSHFRKVWSK